MLVEVWKYGENLALVNLYVKTQSKEEGYRTIIMAKREIGRETVSVSGSEQRAGDIIKARKYHGDVGDVLISQGILIMISRKWEAILGNCKNRQDYFALKLATM